MPAYASGRTAERHRSWVREQCGTRYDGPAARALAEETMRIGAAAKNNPADLINIALEKLVEAALEKLVRPDWRSRGSPPWTRWPPRYGPG